MTFNAPALVARYTHAYVHARGTSVLFTRLPGIITKNSRGKRSALCAALIPPSGDFPGEPPTHTLTRHLTEQRNRIYVHVRTHSSSLQDVDRRKHVRPVDRDQPQQSDLMSRAGIGLCRII